MSAVKRTSAALAAVAALLLLGSCRPEVSAAPRPAEVDVRMEEYRFRFEPPAAPGRTVFRMVNAGKRSHELVLMEVPDSVPPILEQLRGDIRRLVTTISSVPARPPGGATSFAVDLAPGRYAIVCFLLDPDGSKHDQLGMAEEFRIP